MTHKLAEGEFSTPEESARVIEGRIRTCTNSSCPERTGGECTATMTPIEKIIAEFEETTPLALSGKDWAESFLRASLHSIDTLARKEERERIEREAFEKSYYCGTALPAELAVTLADLKRIINPHE